MNTDTFKKTFESIHEMVPDDFKDHVCTVMGPNQWRCGRPGSSIYMFQVLCRPGVVAVWGDLGEWILRISDSDSLGWLRGSVKSHDYVVSKIKAGERLEFYYEDAQQWARSDDAKETLGDKYKEFMEELEGRAEDLTEHDFLRIQYDLGVDEPHNEEHPTPGVIWLLHCLQWFVDHVDDATPNGHWERMKGCNMTFVPADLQKQRDYIVKTYEQKAPCRSCGEIFGPFDAKPELRQQLRDGTRDSGGLHDDEIVACPKCTTDNKVGFTLFGGTLLYRCP